MNLPDEVVRDIEIELTTPVDGYLAGVRVASGQISARVFNDAQGRYHDGDQVVLHCAESSWENGVFIVTTPEGRRYVVSSHQWRIPQLVDGVTVFLPANVPSPRH